MSTKLNVLSLIKRTRSNLQNLVNLEKNNPNDKNQVILNKQSTKSKIRLMKTIIQTEKILKLK